MKKVSEEAIDKVRETINREVEEIKSALEVMREQKENSIANMDAQIKEKIVLNEQKDMELEDINA